MGESKETLVENLSIWTVLFANYILDQGYAWPGMLEKMWSRTPTPEGYDRQEEWENEIAELIEVGLVEIQSNKRGHEYLIWSESSPLSEDGLRQRYATLRAAFKSSLVEYILDRVDGEENSPIHKALIDLDRADFLPKEMRTWGSTDAPVPVYRNMTESALHAVAMTLQAVVPKQGERILVCGAKGGYLMALAGHMVGEKGLVVGIDWQEEIVAHVQMSLDRYPDVLSHVSVSYRKDVTLGLEEQKPWDVNFI